MLVPSLWKHPPISGLTKILNFWSGLFTGFSCLKDPPKSRTLLNVPPLFYFITPFLNFSGVQREIERERKKNHPFFKEISGWKVKYPPFFTILGGSRAGLCRTKSTPLPEILGTRMRSLRPRSGGAGGRKCNTLLSDRGRFENEDGPHPES